MSIFLCQQNHHIFGAQPPFSLVTRESCRENEGLVVTTGWLPNPSFSCTVPTPPTRPLSRPVTRPRLPVITHHPAHMCLRHIPTQSNFHLVQHRSFHATPGIFHPKREESANRYENGAEHCLVLGWFFERQNSQVIAPHVGHIDVLMPSPSPQFFALTVVPKSKYPENDAILRPRVGKKYFSDQKIWKTVHCGSVWPPPVHVFKTPNGLFLMVKLDKLQAKTYFFFLTFWPRIGCFEGGNRSPIVWFEISCQTPSMGTEFRHPIPMVSTTAQGPLDWRWWLFAIGFQRRSCAKCHLDLDQLTLYTYILVHTCDTGQTRGKKPLEVCRSCCVAVLGRDQTPTR